MRLLGKLRIGSALLGLCVCCGGGGDSLAECPLAQELDPGVSRGLSGPKVRKKAPQLPTVGLWEPESHIRCVLHAKGVCICGQPAGGRDGHGHVGSSQPPRRAAPLKMVLGGQPGGEEFGGLWTSLMVLGGEVGKVGDGAASCPLCHWRTPEGRVGDP